MTTQETVDQAAKMAGDRRAVLVARNIGDSAGNITILDGDGQESPTQFQNCDLDTAIDWAMEDMCGVIVVQTYWDNDTQEFVPTIEEWEPVKSEKEGK